MNNSEGFAHSGVEFESAFYIILFLVLAILYLFFSERGDSSKPDLSSLSPWKLFEHFRPSSIPAIVFNESGDVLASNAAFSLFFKLEGHQNELNLVEQNIIDLFELESIFHRASTIRHPITVCEVNVDPTLQRKLPGEVTLGTDPTLQVALLTIPSTPLLEQLQFRQHLTSMFDQVLSHQPEQFSESILELLIQLLEETPGLSSCFLCFKENEQELRLIHSKRINPSLSRDFMNQMFSHGKRHTIWNLADLEDSLVRSIHEDLRHSIWLLFPLSEKSQLVLVPAGNNFQRLCLENKDLLSSIFHRVYQKYELFKDETEKVSLTERLISIISGEVVNQQGIEALCHKIGYFLNVDALLFASTNGADNELELRICQEKDSCFETVNLSVEDSVIARLGDDISSSLQGPYYDDPLLKELNLPYLIGKQLYCGCDKPLGILCLLYENPKNLPSFVSPFLDIIFEKFSTAMCTVQNESQIRKSEFLRKNLVDFSSQALLVFDRKRNELIIMNSEARKILNECFPYRSEFKIEDLLPDDVEFEGTNVFEWKKILKSNQAYSFRARYFIFDNQSFLEISIQEPDRVHELQDQLHEANLRFDEIFHNHDVGICILDSELNYQLVNQPYADFLEYSPDQLIGRAFSFNQDNSGRELELKRYFNHTKRSSFRLEKAFVSSSSHKVWAEISVSKFSKPENSGSYLVILTDITAQKSVETVMRKNQDTLSSIFEHSGHCLLVNDEELNLIRWNRAVETLLNSSHEELENRSLSTMIHPEDFELERMLQQELLTGNLESYRLEKRLYSESRKDIWVDMSTTRMIDSETGKVQMLHVFTDINQRKRLENDLREAIYLADQANQAKSQFLAAMSHEIRTPLNSVIGLTEILQDTKLDEDQKKYLSTANKAGHTLLGLVNNILDISKIEANELVLKIEPFSIIELVEEVASIMELQAESKGLELIVDVPEDFEANYLGDSRRISQILMNLVSNAVKFTQEGKVIIQVESIQENLIIKVMDTGIGIAEDKVETIFQPFTQEDGSTSRKYGGTGLGLTLSRRFAQAMGGELELVSSLKDSGSVFQVVLPLDKMHSSELITAEISQESLESDANEKILNILIVEDSQDNLLLLEAFLSRLNHRYTMVESGIEAVNLYQKQEFDFVIMDIQLPGMDGHEATRHIRNIEVDSGRKPAFICALTANVFQEDVQKSKASGCDDHYGKPITKKQFRQMLQKALAKLECSREPSV